MKKIISIMTLAVVMAWAAFSQNVEIVNSYDSMNKNSENEEYLYFDNILIKDDRAAIHYWFVKTDFETGERIPWDGMYFYHFEKDGSKVKLIEKIGK